MAPISMHHLYFTAPTEATTPTSECDDNGNLSVRTQYPMNIDGSATSDFSTRAPLGLHTGGPSTSGEHSHSFFDASTGATSAAPPSPPAEKHRRTQLFDPGPPLPREPRPFLPCTPPPLGLKLLRLWLRQLTLHREYDDHPALLARIRKIPSGSKASSPPRPRRSPRPPPARAPTAKSARTSLDTPPTYQFTPMAQSEAEAPLKRRASLLRTLRGEANVLSGKMRRDPARVEAGRRMMGGV
ncbi:hypothetical protein FB451DRAFT_1401556 [Mycena latifolia]|nr:hypothetical protein FB451DRAFT_1401556 [Mycena latifolia]